ncbi:MAG: LysM peptidoglycan-binding domain-containing protein [Bdellovibrionota bacterium]
MNKLHRLFYAAAPIFFLSFSACQALKSNPPSHIEKTDQEVAQELNQVQLDSQQEPGSMDQEVQDFAKQEVGLPEVPMMVNQKVQIWLEYFQGRGSKAFARWLARSGRYIPMMERILSENGLPSNLVYLSMIESGFTPHAYSRAAAVGPWQFVRRTGIHYGLKVNWWIDERRHPEKSTIAAAQYLKDLYDEFQHWYLAAAGYNAGEGKISRAISRYQTEDYWELSKYRYLKPETKNYVPKMLAAAMIASEPQKYGFTNIIYEEPISYDRVIVSEPVELKHIAAAIGASVSDLKFLNPDLLRDVTPPNYPDYELHVPVGTGEALLAAYPNLPRYEIKDVVIHRVRSGEALSVIAKRYGVSTQSIMSYNNLKSANRIRAGQNLTIPIPSGRSATRASYQSTKKVHHADEKGMYRVQSGDTLWDLSKIFGVSVENLKRWNQIGARDLRPGQWIRVKDNSGLDAHLQKGQTKDVYTVRRGDSLWEISKQHDVTVAMLVEKNQLDPNETLRPGTKLFIP